MMLSNVSFGDDGFPPIPSGMSRIIEGSTAVLHPTNEHDVFYNNVQCYNRDVSVLMLKLYIEQRKKEHAQRQIDKKVEPSVPFGGVRVLEALSATGLRSLRYIKEVPVDDNDIQSILVNDVDENAVCAIKRNIEYNSGNASVHKLQPNVGDACDVMFAHRHYNKQFDVIDLDPYGSAMPFLETSVQAIADGGLLAVTCTDKAVLCGNKSEACYVKYGSMPLRGGHCHEGALRVLLQSIATACARHKKHIVPLASLSVDFYVRVFVRVYRSPLQVKRLASRLGNIYECVGCAARGVQRLGKVNVKADNPNSVKYTPGTGPPVNSACDVCGNTSKYAGPFWMEPLHDQQWLARALTCVQPQESKQLYGTRDRMLGMLTAASEELPDVPLFFTLSELCKNVRMIVPSKHDFESALMMLGYRVSGSHTNPNALKTDAPVRVLYSVLKSWLSFKKGPLPKLKDGHPGKPIMECVETANIDWAKAKAMPPLLKRLEVSRFPQNPEENWGPKSRARAGKKGEPALTLQQRSRANQGKRSKKKRSHSEMHNTSNE